MKDNFPARPRLRSGTVILPVRFQTSRPRFDTEPCDQPVPWRVFKMELDGTGHWPVPSVVQAFAIYQTLERPWRSDQPQDETIFRLLLHQSGAMIGKMVSEHHPSPATLRRVTVASWLRCRGLVAVRRNQYVATAATKVPAPIRVV